MMGAIGGGPSPMPDRQQQAPGLQAGQGQGGFPPPGVGQQLGQPVVNQPPVPEGLQATMERTESAIGRVAEVEANGKAGDGLVADRDPTGRLGGNIDMLA